jgi:pyridoxine/pyridoxamine 5'-phosphate oxidase
MTKDDVYNFLNQKMLMVIATVNAAGRPESAVIGFGQTKDLRLLFATSNTSRKYANLKREPHVACVIGWDGTETVQYEGTATELTADELDIVRQNYWTKSPYAEKNHAGDDQRYFMVTPTWLRHSNIGSKPWDITELTF